MTPEAVKDPRLRTTALEETQPYNERGWGNSSVAEHLGRHIQSEIPHWGGSGVKESSHLLSNGNTPSTPSAQSLGLVLELV